MEIVVTVKILAKVVLAMMRVSVMNANIPILGMLMITENVGFVMKLLVYCVMNTITQCVMNA